MAPKNLKTNKHLKYISDWTETRKIKLNVNKTNQMILNFTEKYQKKHFHKVVDMVNIFPLQPYSPLSLSWGLSNLHFSTNLFWPNFS